MEVHGIIGVKRDVDTALRSTGVTPDWVNIRDQRDIRPLFVGSNRGP